MTLEIKAKVMKRTDGGMRNGAICHKLNLPALTVARFLKDKSRTLVELVKPCPFVSAMIRKREDLLLK
jgi:hypothetical protein